MNIKQGVYLLSKPINNHFGIPLCMFSTYLLINGLSILYSLPEAPQEMAFKFGVGSFGLMAGTYYSTYGIPLVKEEVDLVRTKIKVNSKKEEFPFEHANRIIISDKEGLENIISKTQKGESFEWSSILKSKMKDNNAIIYSIVDSEDAEKKGLVSKINPTLMKINLEKVNKDYNGYQHFHPKFRFLEFITKGYINYFNYSINMLDRSKPLNWINLLSFNTKEGPELIGFNRNYVYLPANSQKSILKKAKTKDVLKYLN